MGFLIVYLLLIAIGIFFLVKGNNIFHPVFLFLVYWGVIAFTAVLIGVIEPKYEISLLTQSIIAIGCIFFLLGFCITKKTRGRLLKSITKPTYFKKYVSLVLLFISLVVLTICTFNAFRLMLSGYSFSELRYNHHAEVVGRLDVLYKFIALPISASLPVLFASIFICYRKINIKVLLLSLYTTVCCFLCDGGRTIIFIWLVCVAYMLVYVFKSNKKISDKIKKRIKRITVVVAVLVILVFIIRSSNIFATVFIYFDGSVLFFDKNIVEYQTLFDHNFLFASYQGLLRPIYGVLEMVFGYQSHFFNNASRFLMYTQDYASTTYFGGPYNYFTTLFAYFYVDFGILGVIIHSLFYGFLCKKVYTCLRFRKNYQSQGLFLFMTISILLSTMNYFFAEVTLSWGLVFYLISVERPKYSYFRKRKTVLKLNNEEKKHDLYPI